MHHLEAVIAVVPSVAEFEVIAEFGAEISAHGEAFIEDLLVRLGFRIFKLLLQFGAGIFKVLANLGGSILLGRPPMSQ